MSMPGLFKGRAWQYKVRGKRGSPFPRSFAERYPPGQGVGMATEGQHAGRGFADRLQFYLPRIVLSPTILAATIFIYGFILWTAWISLTRSGLLPRYELAGFL